MAVNPFDGIASETLFQWALTLGLGCGRARSVLHHPRKAHLCSLLQIANTELQRRNFPHPVPPYYSGNPPKA